MVRDTTVSPLPIFLNYEDGNAGVDRAVALSPLKPAAAQLARRPASGTGPRAREVAEGVTCRPHPG